MPLFQSVHAVSYPYDLLSRLKHLPEDGGSFLHQLSPKTPSISLQRGIGHFPSCLVARLPRFVPSVVNLTLDFISPTRECKPTRAYRSSEHRDRRRMGRLFALALGHD